MKPYLLGYIDRPSPLHRLSGAAKLVIFLEWSILAMAGYDTRILLASSVLGFVLFALSKIKIRDVSFVFRMLALFMVFNLLAVYLFSPEEGVAIYGTRHLVLAGAGRFTLTLEQIFYEFNIFLKYCQIAPLAIVLIATTHPSEFAASLNRIGVHCYIACAVSLAMRYIPDISRDYTMISRSQQARGIELSKKANIFRRIRGASAILVPLIFSSLERIGAISGAMELRGFGRHKKRTWYSGRPFSRADIVSLAVSAVVFAFGMWFTFRRGSRFFNPFAGTPAH